jgi:hypothetical protein
LRSRCTNQGRDRHFDGHVCRRSVTGVTRHARPQRSAGLESQAEDDDGLREDRWLDRHWRQSRARPRVLMIGNPEAIITIAPALIGGVAVVAWPWRINSRSRSRLDRCHRRLLADRLDRIPLPAVAGLYRPRPSSSPARPCRSARLGFGPLAVSPPSDGCTFRSRDWPHASSRFRAG